jgi:hypothetical protein
VGDPLVRAARMLEHPSGGACSLGLLGAFLLLYEHG